MDLDAVSLHSTANVTLHHRRRRLHSDSGALLSRRPGTLLKLLLPFLFQHLSVKYHKLNYFLFSIPKFEYVRLRFSIVDSLDGL